MFGCPVCRLKTLRASPYIVWPPPPGIAIYPPYENQLGVPSYEECSVCRFKFGQEDNPGTRLELSFEQYRQRWQANRQLLPGPGRSDPEPSESWSELIARFESYDQVPQANANAALLRRCHDEWATKVQVRPSMHSLAFARLEEDYPFNEHVRVEWLEGIYQFTLSSQQSRVVVTEDRCFAANAVLLLRSFLLQLTGDPPVSSATESDDWVTEQGPHPQSTNSDVLTEDDTHLILQWQRQRLAPAEISAFCYAAGWTQVKTIKVLRKHFHVKLGDGKKLVDEMQDPMVRKSNQYLRLQAELAAVLPADATDADFERIESSTGLNKKLWALVQADRLTEAQSAIERFNPESMTFPPVTIDEARQIVLSQITRWDVGLELLDTHTIEYEFGWSFFYQTSKFIETQNPPDMAAGNGALILDKFTAALWTTESAFPTEAYISNYRATGDPNKRERNG